MSSEGILNAGTELILEAAGASASISDGSFRELDSDDRQPTDNPGYTLGIFEFSTDAGGFSAAPTAGAVINIYEQKINSNGNDAPDVSGTYMHDFIGSIPVEPQDSTPQNPSILLPIHRYGGKYWAEWLDGGAGTASIDAGWETRLIPCAFGN